MKLELSAPNWRYYFNVAFRSPRPGLKAHRLTPPPRPACLLHPRATSGPGVAGCHLERSMSLFPFLVRVAPTALSVWAGELRGPPRAAGGLLPPSPHPTPALGARGSGRDMPAGTVTWRPRQGCCLVTQARPDLRGALSAQCRPRPIPSGADRALAGFAFLCESTSCPAQEFQGPAPHTGLCPWFGLGGPAQHLRHVPSWETCLLGVASLWEGTGTFPHSLPLWRVEEFSVTHFPRPSGLTRQGAVLQRGPGGAARMGDSRPRSPRGVRPWRVRVRMAFLDKG